MRFGIVAFISGLILTVFSAVMLIPALLDFMYDEGKAVDAFISSAGISVLVGVLLSACFYKKWQRISVKEMFLTTSSVWLIITLFSALPFYFSDLGLDYTSSFFEAMSGLTSTGATNFTHLDDMPKGILLWRAIMQWIGGIGIVMIAIAILPMLKIGGMQMYRTESSGEIDGKTIPRISQIIKFIICIYLFFTLCCIISLHAAGLSLFDAVCHAFSCISTGGFSTHDSSIAYFKSPLIEWLLIIFMIIGAIPFIAYYHIFSRSIFKLTNDSQIRTMLIVIISISAILALWLWFGTDVQGIEKEIATTIRKSLFSVTSIITTTGYSVANYELWGTFAIVLFFFITFIGGCSGSSSGGIKIFRFSLLYLNLVKYLKNMIYPHGVFSLRYNGKDVPSDIISGIVVFISIFCISLVLLSLALSLCGLDIITSLSGAAAALTNVGPGLGSIVGPEGNYSSLPETAKWLLSFGMMLGRLEFTTITVLLIPMTWKDA